MEYKDMTFCPFYTDCADGDHCFRALTETIKAEAEIAGLPTCQYTDKPPCHKGTIETFKAHESDGQTAQEVSMAKFTMSAAVTVSAYTEVEADSLEEAIEIASERDCELGFNGCGYEADEYWIIKSADGMPMEITGEEA